VGLVFGAASEARADRDVRQLNVGISGGFQLTSPDTDLLGDRSKVVSLSNAGWINIHAGYTVVAPYLTFELNLSIVPLGTNETDQTAIALPVTLDAVIAPITGVAEPFFSVGAGVNALVGGDLGNDADFLFGAALGLRLRPINELAIRVEVRVAVSDAITEPLAASPIFALGIDYLALPVEGSGKGDGGGTPSGGTGGTGGDKGGDKACKPDDPNCNDADADGIVDAQDACPDAAGKADMKGCPDTDKDGVADFEDDCPIHAGKPETKGCPDRDGDGLHDGQDACPEDRGTKEQQGCPDPEALRVEDLGEPLAGIAFKRKTAKLLPSANKPLNKVAALLLANPELKIEVRVWTTGRGKAQRHKQLSASRAYSVMQALIERGVNGKRLRAAGQGKNKKGGEKVIMHRLATVKVLE